MTGNAWPYFGGENMAIEIETIRAIASCAQGATGWCSPSSSRRKRAKPTTIGPLQRLCLPASRSTSWTSQKDMSRERDRGLRGNIDEEVNWDDIEIGKPYPIGSKTGKSKRTRSKDAPYS